MTSSRHAICVPGLKRATMWRVMGDAAEGIIVMKYVAK